VQNQTCCTPKTERETGTALGEKLDRKMKHESARFAWRKPTGREDYRERILRDLPPQSESKRVQSARARLEK
jgi:hypothetical protein